MNRAYLILLVSMTLSGCCSIRTTPLDRTENDCLVVNPEKPLNGIPVSLPVPTHLELVVSEKNFWTIEDDGKDCPKLKQVSGCNATREVKPNLCYTEKVFVVDPVKPGSGEQNYSFVFRSSTGAMENGKPKFPDDLNEDKSTAGMGYLRGIKYRVDDTTITDSANLLENVLGLVTAINRPTDGAAGGLVSNNLVETSRVVAYGRFDINAAGFEEEVCAFLEQHVNQASKEFTCTCPFPNACDSACKDNCKVETK